jgi:hypothetical protein
MAEPLKEGDAVEIVSWGKPIRGVITMIGHYTQKPTQMRRDDNGKLRAIMGDCRKIESE